MISIGIGLLSSGARLRSQAQRDLLAFRARMAQSSKTLGSTAADKYEAFASGLYELPAARLDFAAFPTDFNVGSGSTAYTFQRRSVSLLSTAKWDATGILTDKVNDGGNPALRYLIPSSTRYFSVMHVGSGYSSQPDFPCRISIQPNGHYFTDGSIILQGGSSVNRNNGSLSARANSASLDGAVAMTGSTGSSTSSVLILHKEPVLLGYQGTTKYTSTTSTVDKQFTQVLLGARFESTVVAFGTFTHKFLLFTPLDLESQWSDMLDLYNSTLGA